MSRLRSLAVAVCPEAAARHALAGRNARTLKEPSPTLQPRTWSLRGTCEEGEICLQSHYLLQASLDAENHRLGVHDKQHYILRHLMSGVNFAGPLNRKVGPCMLVPFTSFPRPCQALHQSALQQTLCTALCATLETSDTLGSGYTRLNYSRHTAKLYFLCDSSITLQRFELQGPGSGCQQSQAPVRPRSDFETSTQTSAQSLLRGLQGFKASSTDGSRISRT